MHDSLLLCTADAGFQGTPSTLFPVGNESGRGQVSSVRSVIILVRTIVTRH